MLEKLLKAVKSSNKKRGRNITVGAVIGFLLSCTAVMGADEYLWIKNDGGTIKFSTDTTDGENGEWKAENPYEENSWNESTSIYINNITLFSMNLGGDLNFINNGTINGNSNISSMKSFINNGIMLNNGRGNAIYNVNLNIETMKNEGVIKSVKGRGIYFENIRKGTIINRGIISGNSTEGMGEGINFDGSGKFEMLENEGMIIGNGGTLSGYGIYVYSTEGDAIINKGITISSSNNEKYSNGILVMSPIKNIINTGVIYGKSNAIKNNKGTVENTVNYGILVNESNNPVVDGLTVENKGLAFKINDGTYSTDTVEDFDNFGKTYNEEIIVGYERDNDGKVDSGKPIKHTYTIINAKAINDSEDDIGGTESITIENGTLTYNDSSNQSHEEKISSDKKYILNGIADTLKVSGRGNELNNSIVNAYGTAVVMDKDMSMLTLNNTVVNGSISDSGSTVNMGGEGNILTLQGNSVINTNDVAIKVSGENNIVTLEGDAKVNGKMESSGNNTLNLYGKTDSSMNMLNDISGFVNMNIDKNVTFFEDVKVTGTNIVTVEETGVLNLRLKKVEDTIKTTGIPKATHAFLGNNMIIQGEGNGTDIAGTLRFITNGIGKEICVDMANIELKNLYIKTSSVIDRYEINDKVNVILGANKDLDGIYKPENTRKNRYEFLNNIYKGIYSSTGENLDGLRTLISFNNLGNNYDENISNEEQLKNLMSYLGSIYTETPYSFSSELSRRSAGMFRDIVTENNFRPDLDKWLIMGGLTHADGGTKDTYYGQNYHEIDMGTSDTDVDMKLTGAYALGKYGYSENVSLGVTVGGNRSEAELSMSKVKGNSGYIGAFAENYRGNLTLKAGAGIQYSEYDADRNTIGGHSYNEKYSDMTYDIYLNGRYSHNIGENLFLEPYGTLSYTYIDQDGADEGSKVLGIETDSKSFDYTTAKVGVDLKKVIPHEKGKSTLSAGVSYTRILDGADEEHITGRFKGGSDFDILVAHKNEHSIGLNAKYALELENGILFDVKGTYSVERDSHNQSGKNKTKGEWIVGAGLGYKF